MEEQNTQSLETFEDFNKNPAGIHTGMGDTVDTSSNGILTYVDQAEDEHANMPDLLASEKQMSETSSATDMTTSTSQDTGFGSASVSEISSPVENNCVTDRSLHDNTANTSESEHYDTTLNNIKDENDENTSNSKVRDENVLNTTLKETENEHIEKVASSKDKDESGENEAQKETLDKNFENAAYKEIVDEKFGDSAHKDMVDESSVHTADKETDEHIEIAADNKAVDDNIEIQTEVKAEPEIAAYKNVEIENSAEIENVMNAEQKQAHDDSFRSAALRHAADEHVERTVNGEADSADNANNTETKDENTEKIENTKVVDASIENVPSEEDFENVQYSAHEQIENANVEKATNYIAVNESVTNIIYKEEDNDNAVSVEDKLTEDKDDKETANDNTEDQIVKQINTKAEDENDNKANDSEELKMLEKILNLQTGDDTFNDAANKDNNTEDLSIQHVDENVENTATETPEGETFEKVGNNKTEDENIAGDTRKDEKTTDNDEKMENVIDILGNGLLKKKVLVPGKGEHTRPINGDIVTLKVDGQLSDGTHVDTGEITFNLNDGDVILAFELAAALMEEGEKCELFTSERYAYGSLGRDPDIPKDASITYILELVNIQKSPDISEINFDQRLKMGEAKRERGNYLFGRADYSGAINSYNKAVKLLDNPELNEGIDEISRAVVTESWVKCYNNLAACQLKITALDAAIKSCEKVLSAQEDNVKALFRLGKAYGAKGEVNQAIAYLRRAIRLDPESKLMQQEMLNLTRLKNKETATEKALYQRMLGVKPGDKSSVMDEEKRKGNSNKLVKWTLVAGGMAAVLISVGLTWYRSS